MCSGVRVESTTQKSSMDIKSWLLLLLLVLITIFTYPDFSASSKVGIRQVWYYGWITAVSTGAGVIPFFFVSEPTKFWMGISNGSIIMKLFSSIMNNYYKY